MCMCSHTGVCGITVSVHILYTQAFHTDLASLSPTQDCKVHILCSSRGVSLLQCHSILFTADLDPGS